VAVRRLVPVANKVVQRLFLFGTSLVSAQRMLRPQNFLPIVADSAKISCESYMGYYCLAYLSERWHVNR
jgi:hypothetical protein